MLLNKVRFQRESFDVVRGKEVVARLVPAEDTEGGTVGDLVDCLGDFGPAGSDFADDLERIQVDQPSLPDEPWPS